MVQRFPSPTGPRFANRMLQGEKEKLVRLVNEREKKRLVVRGMATLVPLPQFVVFADLVGWYSTGTRLCCCCGCMRSAERVQSRKM